MPQDSEERRVAGRNARAHPVLDRSLMSVLTASTAPPIRPGFRHEALIYSDLDDFVSLSVPYILEGLGEGEPVLVVVSAEKIQRLRAALPDSKYPRLEFGDMAQVGANPAHIIPVWRSFVARHVADGQRRMRGIGEPITPERTDDELVECQLHEALLNLAFARDEGFSLLCPYNATALPASVLDEACESHQATVGRSGSNGAYRKTPWAKGPFSDPLPSPPETSHVHFSDQTSVEAARDHVRTEARRLGHDEVADRAALLVHEVMANSMRHGGGHGSLQIWSDGARLTCEVRDRGWIQDPLIGRVAPTADQEDGRGLWLVQQLSDLTQIRSTPDGTTVRIHLRRR